MKILSIFLILLLSCCVLTKKILTRSPQVAKNSFIEAESKVTNDDNDEENETNQQKFSRNLKTLLMKKILTMKRLLKQEHLKILKKT